MVGNQFAARVAAISAGVLSNSVITRVMESRVTP